MSAAFGASERVDLIDDDRLNAGESFAGLRGQHQVERLRGSNENVGWAPRDLAAFLLRGVARANANGWLLGWRSEPLRRQGDALDWATQVLVDVDGECAQR